MDLYHPPPGFGFRAAGFVVRFRFRGFVLTAWRRRNWKRALRAEAEALHLAEPGTLQDQTYG